MCSDFSGFLDSLAKELGKITSKNQNDGFNIFQILGVETDEVKACRFIGALLDPKEKHGLGETPLKLFLKDVLKVSNEVDPNARIVLEDRIKDDRRVDIVIYNGNRVYPIEAKIKAKDQKHQLFDYYKYYFGDSEAGIIYYLTPSGWQPAKESINTLKKDEQFKCLSFEGQIKNWLDDIITKITDEPKRPNFDICGIIKQYRGVIIDMCKKATENKAILGAAGIENNSFPENDTDFEKLNALISILSANGDTNGIIQKEIQKAYLTKNLKMGDDFVICEKFDGKDHKYAILAIREKTSSEPIAWISIETNLYIECVVKKGDYKGWHNGDNWGYLFPEGYTGSKYCLNNCEGIKKYRNKSINIEGFLNDITNARDKKSNT